VRCLAERRRRWRQRRRSAKLDGEPSAADEPRTVSHGYTTRGIQHAAYDMHMRRTTCGVRHAACNTHQTAHVRCLRVDAFRVNSYLPSVVTCVCCKIDYRVLAYSLLAVHICTGAQVRAFCAARRARVDGEAARRAQARQPAGPFAHRIVAIPRHASVLLARSHARAHPLSVSLRDGLHRPERVGRVYFWQRASGVLQRTSCAMSARKCRSWPITSKS
jgi:hypothetical protein